MKSKPADIRVVRPAGLDGVELQIGSTRPASGGYVPAHWHEEYHLCAHTRGSGELHCRGGFHPNPPGSINLVEPGEVHANRSFGPSGCDFLALNFAPHYFRSIAGEGARAAPPAFRSPTASDPEIFARFLALHRCLARPSSVLERQTEFLDFLAFLLARHGREPFAASSPGREARAVAAVRDLLQAHYAEPIGLDRLIEATGISGFHLTRVFRRETGLPPHAFLTQVRIARAKELLRRGVTPARVAAETGFCDQSHLSRVFVRMAGMTPGAYARGARRSAPLADRADGPGPAREQDRPRSAGTAGDSTGA